MDNSQVLTDVPAGAVFTDTTYTHPVSHSISEVSGLQTALDGKTSETSNTGSAQLPSGTTAQRDGTPAAGYLRYNTTDGGFEGYDGAEWGAIGGEAVTTFPFYKSDGTSDTIAITNGTFPFYKSDGTADNIGVS